MKFTVRFGYWYRSCRARVILAYLLAAVSSWALIFLGTWAAVPFSLCSLILLNSSVMWERDCFGPFPGLQLLLLLLLYRRFASSSLQYSGCMIDKECRRVKRDWQIQWLPMQCMSHVRGTSRAAQHSVTYSRSYWYIIDGLLKLTTETSLSNDGERIVAE